MFGSFPAVEATKNDSQPTEANAATPSQEPVEVVEKPVEPSAADKTSEEATDSSQTQSDDQGEDSSDRSDSEERRGRRGFERRIQKFNQKLSAKDAEIEYWRTQAMSAAKPQAPVEPQGKPRFEDYNDVESFTDALTDWKISQGLTQVRVQTEQVARAQTYNQRVAEFKQSTPDFDTVMSDFVAEYGDDVIPEIVSVAMESEVGPQLAYYLARNTDEVDRIASLPAHRRLLELGKLEDRVAAQGRKPAAKPEKTQVSRAAPPVEPVKGTGRVENNDLSDPTLNYSEWLRRRQAQLKKR